MQPRTMLLNGLLAILACVPARADDLSMVTAVRFLRQGTGDHLRLVEPSRPPQHERRAEWPYFHQLPGGSGGWYVLMDSRTEGATAIGQLWDFVQWQLMISTLFNPTSAWFGQLTGEAALTVNGISVVRNIIAMTSEPGYWRNWTGDRMLERTQTLDLAQGDTYNVVQILFSSTRLPQRTYVTGPVTDEYPALEGAGGLTFMRLNGHQVVLEPNLTFGVTRILTIYVDRIYAPATGPRGSQNFVSGIPIVFTSRTTSESPSLAGVHRLHLGIYDACAGDAQVKNADGIGCTACPPFERFTFATRSCEACPNGYRDPRIATNCIRCDIMREPVVVDGTPECRACDRYERSVYGRCVRINCRLRDIQDGPDRWIDPRAPVAQRTVGACRCDLITPSDYFRGARWNCECRDDQTLEGTRCHACPPGEVRGEFNQCVPHETFTAPRGSLSETSCRAVAGTVTDADRPGSAVRVSVFLNGPSPAVAKSQGTQPGRLLTIVPASPDFRVEISASDQRGLRRLHVYALDDRYPDEGNMRGWDVPLTGTYGVIVSCNRPLGAIERVTADGVVVGWAVDTAQPERPVRVRFAVDGTLVAEVSAERHHLVAAAEGFGPRHGFSFRLPARYRDGRIHVVAVLMLDAHGGFAYGQQSQLLGERQFTLRPSREGANSVQ